MEHKKSAGIIAITSVFALFLRFLQIFLFTDFVTGFHKTKYAFAAGAVMVLIFLACVAIYFVAQKTRRLRVNNKTTGALTTIASVILAVSLLYTLLFEMPYTVINWQIVLMKTAVLLMMIYCAVLALGKSIGIKIPDIIHIVPAVYLIFRIIYCFISISSLSIISENVFLTASYCAALFFFVSYAKFYNQIDESRHTLYAKSVLSLVLCILTVVPNIIANLFTLGGYSHITTIACVEVAALGLFIADFTFNNFFAKK